MSEFLEIGKPIVRVCLIDRMTPQFDLFKMLSQGHQTTIPNNPGLLDTVFVQLVAKCMDKNSESIQVIWARDPIPDCTLTVEVKYDDVPVSTYRAFVNTTHAVLAIPSSVSEIRQETIHELMSYFELKGKE